MNPLGLTSKVRIERAGNDAAVIGLLAMQPEEVAAVQRDDHAAVGTCSSQDLGVGHAASELAPDERDHIVAVRPQRLDHSERYVLVGEQPRHNSGGLVLEDVA